MSSKSRDADADGNGDGEPEGFVHANGFNSSYFSDRIDDDGFDKGGRYRFADRFVLAESWRIAAEVASRHPELRMSRVQDADKNPLLLLHKGATGWRAQFDLFSGIGYEREGEFRRYSWLTVFAQHDPLTVIKRLQVASRLRIIPVRRAETGHSSAYQVIAALLGLHVGSTSTWQAIPVRLFGSDDVTTDAALLNNFFSARRAADEYIDSALLEAKKSGDAATYWHEPLWFLYEGFDVRAVVDEAGLVHLQGSAPVVDIRALHTENGRSWPVTAAHVYGIIKSVPNAPNQQ